jgi:adenosylhomocysteinase
VQALACEWLARCHGSLAPGVHELPSSLDDDVARLKLETMGVAIDSLNEDQQAYLASWAGHA